MRCFMLAAAMVLACGTAQAKDHAKDLTNLQLAQATPPPQAAPTAPAAPAPQAAPAAQATPEAAAPTTAQPKPAKKKQARRRETDEEKARRIAAKYGVSW
jgi:hypothetical protein